MAEWKITDLAGRGDVAVRQAAAILLEEFRELTAEWPDMESALAEVRLSLTPGRISRVAVDGDGRVLGWAGGISGYSGNVWELHPLVVSRTSWRSGIGSALVADLEEIVRARGALTIWLGTDDEESRTSIGGRGLFPGVLRRLIEIRNLHGHPYEFYQKLGFEIVGVMPDANGLGKPDIFMAKSLAK